MADAVALGTPLRLVGRPLPRHDARDKVAAATAYAADWAMPGMLHAAVLRSPYPSARIVKLETAGAERMPGVAVVLTAKDVPRNTLSTDVPGQTTAVGPLRARSEEHTSELQSLAYLVCRLLLEKKKQVTAYVRRA